MENQDQDPSEAGRPSKSQVKREMEALQAMGEELVDLGKESLAKIDLPEKLREAIRDAQRFKMEARRRQLQYVGRLMRDVDPAPIRAALDEIKGLSATAIARQHALERLRTRLMEDEATLADIARDYPAADFQHLRQLRRNALKEQAQGKPPRAYRELFRVLRALQEDSHDPDDVGTADE